MPRLPRVHSNLAVEPSGTSTSWWTERNCGRALTVGCLTFDILLLDDALCVMGLGIGKAWVVMLAENMTWIY